MCDSHGQSKQQWLDCTTVFTTRSFSKDFSPRLICTATKELQASSFRLSSHSQQPAFFIKTKCSPSRRLHVPLAVLTNRLWKFDEVRSTFDKIDVDRKGHITEADLHLFAERHNLPQSYVRPFMDALRQQQQQQQQQQQISVDATLNSRHDVSPQAVSYRAFREFVLEREAGLRESFQLFDTDGDGKISYQDLDVSLSRVAICCPSNRCVLRTRHQVVAELLGRLNMEPGRLLDFSQFRSFFMLLPERDQLVEYWLSGPAALACADMGCHFSILEHSHKRRGAPWGHLLAGAVAGAASRSATAPLETLRLAAMAGSLPAGSSLLAAAQRLVAEGGVKALFRGNGVNVLRSAPARAVDFFAFDLFKSWLGDQSYSRTFAAAGLAGTFSWVLLYPLEVVRSRMTLDTVSRYGGLLDCVRSMARSEGSAAFYRGLGPSVAAIAPEAAITYGLHDLLKRNYKQLYNREPDIAASLCCGVLAAWSGQLVAFPLETVSRRMQLAGPAAAVTVPPGAPAGAAVAAAAAAGQGSSMAQVLAGILKEGGPAALYRGIGAATLRLIPSAIVSFGTYELMRRFITDLETKQEEALARAQQQQLHGVLHRAKQCNQLLQQVVEQGPAAAVAALTDAQQCQVCRPEAVLEAAVLGLQRQELGSAASSSSSSSSSNGSSRRSLGGIVCSSGGTGGSLASTGSSQCGILVIDGSGCSESSSNNSSSSSGSSTAPGGCQNLPCCVQQQRDVAHDACSTAADCSSNGCMTVSPLVIDVQPSSSSGSSSNSHNH